ncbi:hypothetical protein OG496_19870 [Streptomyces sp. NBC_00988]|uniref:hypothetical protein n=1 Tax=Streptomyces sp. NBC_00988 TaxID=2903704 RepID=UPI00386DA3AA|nr:hypothetical protein OG496_19870 [Streptomyces sp. NBC_00988]
MSEEHDEDQSAARPGDRSRRLRRRAAAVAGAVGIALVGVVGALLGPWGDATPGARDSPATPTSVPTSRADLLATLTALLPEGRVTERKEMGAETGPDAEVVYDDGNGPAAIGIGLTSFEPGVQAEMTIGCPDTTQTEFDSCVTSELPDKTRITLLKTYTDPTDRRTDTKVWSAALLTPSGQYISVTEWNSTAGYGAPVSRAEPPLSGAQLKKLVTSEVWRRAVGPYDEGKRKEWAAAPTPSEDGGLTGGAVLDTLVPLLPKNVQVLYEDEDYPCVFVHDGRTNNVAEIDSTVRVDIQHVMPTTADELYGADAETLPDGTRVTTRQESGDKGVAASALWTVDTVRTDGLRVVISAYNPGHHGTPRLPTPALTMEQLREIALSPQWDQYR